MARWQRSGPGRIGGYRGPKLSGPFESVGGYHAALVTREDRDLFSRLARTGRVLSDPNLVVCHTGRRAHNVGWPRLILLFLANTISYRLRGKLISKEWKVER